MHFLNKLATLGFDSYVAYLQGPHWTNFKSRYRQSSHNAAQSATTARFNCIITSTNASATRDSPTLFPSVNNTTRLYTNYSRRKERASISLPRSLNVWKKKPPPL